MPNQQLLVVGSFTEVNGLERLRMAKLDPDGSLDGAFAPEFTGPVFSTEIRSLVLQGDGKIVAGGLFQNVNGVALENLVRLNADGSVDPSFVVNVNRRGVNALLVLDDQSILVGGNFTEIGGQARGSLARLLSDGSVAADFSTPFRSRQAGVGTSVNALAIDSDGVLLIGGSFNFIGDHVAKKLARFGKVADDDLCFVVVTSNDEAATLCL